MTSYLCAIDPGKRHVGVALFCDGALLDAATVRAVSWTLPELSSAMVAWEWLVDRLPDQTRLWRIEYWAETPQSYAGHDGREDDLESLRRMLKYFAVQIAPVRLRTILPRTWKGNVPKLVHHARIQQLLSSRELDIFNRSGSTHDTRDAIALGLYKVGRSGRGGTRP